MNFSGHFYYWLLNYLFDQQAYTSQIVVMAMLALAIGADTLSNQARREAIIDGLFYLPREFLLGAKILVSNCP